MVTALSHIPNLGIDEHYQKKAGPENIKVSI